MGSAVFAQRHGWPQGGALSEPATLAEAGFYIQALYDKHAAGGLPSYQWQGRPLCELLFAILHVDDLMVASPFFCEGCVLSLLNSSFPDDFKWEAEEAGRSVRFLSYTVHAHGRRVHALPFLPNITFALGLAEWPKLSRCPIFWDRWSTPLEMLRTAATLL